MSNEDPDKSLSTIEKHEICLQWAAAACLFTDAKKKGNVKIEVAKATNKHGLTQRSEPIQQKVGTN